MQKLDTFYLKIVLVHFCKINWLFDSLRQVWNGGTSLRPGDDGVWNYLVFLGLRDSFLFSFFSEISSQSRKLIVTPFFPFIAPAFRISITFLEYAFVRVFPRDIHISARQKGDISYNTFFEALPQKAAKFSITRSFFESPNHAIKKTIFRIFSRLFLYALSPFTFPIKRWGAESIKSAKA